MRLRDRLTMWPFKTCKSFISFWKKRWQRYRKLKFLIKTVESINIIAISTLWELFLMRWRTTKVTRIESRTQKLTKNFYYTFNWVHMFLIANQSDLPLMILPVPNSKCKSVLGNWKCKSPMLNNLLAFSLEICFFEAYIYYAKDADATFTVAQEGERTSRKRESVGSIPVRNFVFALGPSLTIKNQTERKSEKSKKWHQAVYDSVMMKNCSHTGPLLKLKRT